MIALITSCGRFDLLKNTLESFYANMNHEVFININEDGLSKIGQHKSIEQFLRNYNTEKYYVHLEEDWGFENSYDWISESIKIMEANPDIIKVICRSDSPHPATFDEKTFAILDIWENTAGHTWHGFGWNPGVTRLDLLKQFAPFGKWEQDVSEAIYKAGYKTALLKNGVCKHIGDGRSTHL